jgi:hypothetical protein
VLALVPGDGQPTPAVLLRLPGDKFKFERAPQRTTPLQLQPPAVVLEKKLDLFELARFEVTMLRLSLTQVCFCSRKEISYF